MSDDNFFKTWRKDRDLTQAEAAKSIGVTSHTWWRWENEKRTPHDAIIKLLDGASIDPNHHYVYQVTRTDTGHFYIGVRSFRGHVEEDLYCGSSAWILELRRIGIALEKKIIAEFATREEAEKHERGLIELFDTDPLFANPGAPTRLLETMKASAKAYNSLKKQKPIKPERVKGYGKRRKKAMT